MPDTTHQRLLRAAASLMGEQELATRLKISESLLQSWLRGEAAMPNRKLSTLAEALDSWARRPKPK